MQQDQQDTEEFQLLRTLNSQTTEEMEEVITAKTRMQKYDGEDESQCYITEDRMMSRNLDHLDEIEDEQTTPQGVDDNLAESSVEEH